jgi:carbon storage regulator
MEGHMLVLARKAGGKIFVGDNITITVVEVVRGRVRIGIEAPSTVRIMRDDAQKNYMQAEDAAQATMPFLGARAKEERQVQTQ